MFWRKSIKLGDTILLNSIETTSRKFELKKRNIIKDIRYKFMGHKLWHKCILLLHHYLNFNREFLPLVAEKTIQAIQGQIFCEEFLKKFLESGVKM